MGLSLFNLSLKNLKRKKFRSFSLILVSGLACTLVFSASTVLKSIQDGIELSMARLGADIMVVPKGYELKGSKVLYGGEPSSFLMDIENLNKIKNIPEIEIASPHLYVTSTVLICCTRPNVLIVGYDPESDFVIKPWLSSRLEIKKGQLDYATIGMDSSYAAEGGYISFFGKRFKIKAIARKTGIRFIDFSIFLKMDAARDMVHISARESKKPLHIKANEISSILIKVKSGSSIQKAASKIENTIPGIKAIAARNMVSSIQHEIKNSLGGVLIAGSGSWFITIMLMGIIFTLIVNERKREVGLLRAMGATKFHLIRLIISEASILSLLGCLLGIPIGLILLLESKDMIFTSIGEVGFLWPSVLQILLIGLFSILIVVFSSALATLYPSIRFSRKDPDTSIRRDR